MRNLKQAPALLAMLAAAMVAAACDTEQPGITSPSAEGPLYSHADTTFAGDTTHLFQQVERLGNPLAMEVFVMKREHGTHDVWRPFQDVGHFTDDYIAFMTEVAGRSYDYGLTVARVLLGTPQNPGDKIKYYPARGAGITAMTAGSSTNASRVGWLTYVLNPGVGMGGRILTEDVVDKGLGVVFGSAAGNTNNVSPGLVTDNVGNTNPAMRNTFPYFPAANPAPTQ